jgi:glycosyltransferase involved in cell wall biosynthesis
LKVSGFTIARNAIKLGYPVEQSIRSLLPLVDELVVAVGHSDDGTWGLVNGIGDPRIKAFQTIWDDTKRVGGAVLAEQTNIALERCTGDWAVYLQTDELLHEDEIDTVRDRLKKYLDTPVEGLSFSYVHFYGSFETIQDNWCGWYRREVRAVKTGKGVVSVGDAAGFRISRGGQLQRLIRADSSAHVYHYGWVRPPAVMTEKRRSIRRLYRPDADSPTSEPDAPQSPYRDLGNLRRFTGTHPALVQPLIAARDWEFESHLAEQPPRWLRYIRLAAGCPKDTARILNSRVRLAWNSLMPAPKLR